MLLVGAKEVLQKCIFADPSVVHSMCTCCLSKYRSVMPWRATDVEKKHFNFQFHFILNVIRNRKKQLDVSLNNFIKHFSNINLYLFSLAIVLYSCLCSVSFCVSFTYYDATYKNLLEILWDMGM